MSKTLYIIVTNGGDGSSYPNYTLKKAYALSLGDVIKAYIVIIDANNTRYAIEFDASGAFVRVKTLF